jgi:hypothetical protein
VSLINENSHLQEVLISTTQFSQGNNVVDGSASNINGFLEDTGVWSTQMNTLSCKKSAFTHLETPKLQEVFLSITTSVLTGKECAKFPSLLHSFFFFGVKHVFIQLSLTILF